jgi:succinate-semialdehyde dehydrogenase/glutarate-semialdehyde dehydrogenase
VRTYPLLIGGRRVESQQSIVVCDKFTGDEIGAVAVASADDVAHAAASAWEAHRRQQLEPHRRAEILRAAAGILRNERRRFLDAFVAETGFTEREAPVDLQRTIETLELCAEEATRIAGEVVPIDGARGQVHRFAFTLRLPIGPVCAITPFNSPLNTVAHKIGPAIAAGNPVVLKPASATPITAFLLCDALERAGLPPGWLNVVFGGGGTVGQALVDDERFRFYAFTGSTEVGRRLQKSIGLRRSQMELGAICATIVCEDADVEPVAEKVASAAFRKAGQVCTSVQLLLVHESHVDRVLDELGSAARVLVAGDPRDPGTDIGPMISEREAKRAERWVHEALDAGARAHTDIVRDGPVLGPVVLSGVTRDMKVMAEEIFAPVVSVVPFGDFDEALRIANDSPYGLSAGVFTTSWRTAMRAATELDVGVVQLDETSSSRVDLMPYGGTRESGFGKEGPRYAVEEMTLERLVVFNRPRLNDDGGRVV